MTLYGSEFADHKAAEDRMRVIENWPENPRVRL